MEEHMKNNSKARNREHRTKPSKAPVSIQVKLDRETFEQLKRIESQTALSRDTIFLAGLAWCCKEFFNS